MTATKKRIIWAGAVAFLTVLVDQLSKQWALSALADRQRVPVMGDLFGFQLYFNSGAAFSLGSGSTFIFTAIAALVVIGMPFVIHRIESMPWALSLGLVWGGATGNLIDRLFRAPGVGRGHVVDFMAYSDWFIGNVADHALVIGVILLALFSFRNVPEDRPDDDDSLELGKSQTSEGNEGDSGGQ